MTNATKIALGAGLTLLGLACAKTTHDSQLGTNTNWLAECSTDDECASDAQCLCGVCTKPCTASSQCGEVDDGATCEALEQYALCSGETVAMACVQRCETTADCSAFEDGLCHLGLCIPAPAPAPDASVSGNLDASAPGTPDYRLTRQDALVVLTDVYRPCEDHADCVLVDTTCNGCCNRDAIDADLRALYLENTQLACADYQGAVCDCDWQDQVARCEGGRCSAPLRETLDCYAPDQNAQRVDDPQWVGCTCSEPDDTVCTQHGAMTCEAMSPRPAWIPLENPPCEVGETSTCADELRHATAAACLERFQYCTQISTGEYCPIEE